jgi:dienelactone hydrolase
MPAETDSPTPPLAIFPGRRWARLALAVVAAFVARASGQEMVSEMMPTALTEGGVPVALELVVYRPAGTGPFPTVMFNHGSTGTGSDPVEFTKTWHSPAVAAFFNQRGWMVIFPQRRGRGKSGGLYDEGFTPNRSGYTCDPARSLAGLERALTDLDEVVRHLRTRPDVDAKRMLIGGQSRGGILAITYAGTRPDVFRGAINFVGGWMSDTCANPAAINTVSFVRGAAFPGPTIWLYGENDSFYGLAHSRANHAAFAAAGGQGAFHALNLGPQQNGHNVFLFSDRWGPLVEQFFASLPVPPATTPPANNLVNLSVRARIGSQPLIVGFAIGGTISRQVIVRGIGPSLRQFGLEAAAERPLLTIFDFAAKPHASAGPWAGEPELAAAFAAAGAFPLDAAAADAAALIDLAPGAYTLHVTDAASAGRIVLGELFAAGGPAVGAGLANFSARVVVADGEASSIVGFVVGGEKAARTLIRVAGPALASFGVADAVADPQLTVFDSAGRAIANNDNWGTQGASADGTAEAIGVAAAQAGAFAFAGGSRDAAVLVNLDPGAYTVHSIADRSGTVLVEVYSLTDEG